jgi:transcriptional regulator with XRE-family HTH domain
VPEGTILGAEVQKARKAAKLGQEELARVAGVSPTYLRQVEGGKRSPSLDALLRICGALGIKASRLIARIEKERR